MLFSIDFESGGHKEDFPFICGNFSCNFLNLNHWAREQPSNNSKTLVVCGIRNLDFCFIYKTLLKFNYLISYIFVFHFFLLCLGSSAISHSGWTRDVDELDFVSGGHREVFPFIGGNFSCNFPNLNHWAREQPSNNSKTLVICSIRNLENFLFTRRIDPTLSIEVRLYIVFKIYNLNWNVLPFFCSNRWYFLHLYGLQFVCAFSWLTNTCVV